MINVNDIRADFPILSLQVHGKPLVYLDNGATTQKPLCVIDKIREMYCSVNANVHRGVHFLSQAATDEHEASRRTVQEFIGAASSNEIVFTRGTTEAINLISSSFCREFCKPGDEVIISAMEHHSNIVPWQLQEAISGIKLRILPISDEGEILLEELEKLISSRTKLIAVTHVSNVLGTITPIEKIIETAHRYDIPVLVDAAQSVQHIPVDVQRMDCDFLVFSSHKIYGPTGMGVLYGKEKWLDKLPPYQGGGEMIATVSFEKTTFAGLPFKFEAGTPDYVGSTALATALKYISRIGIENIAKHEQGVLAYATEQLLSIDKLKIYGTSKNKCSVISFLVDGVHHYDMGVLLDTMGIAVRTGHHCAEPLMRRLGVEGTVRASFAVYNTREEVDVLVNGIRRIVKMF
ncbi:MAG TPA: cysteine desulfurase CsdA [Porphyromonadaceae bacterium]|jgi:cysteine desulfurase/selenocysteine lyase|nr:cysteine desulfurase [Proteiniphilum sp. UBA5218]MDD2247518.1 cysteine desulfurase [Proteiniphilum sp.]MDD4016225.1 cysteine desulfurase [Petrimonas sp.]HBG80194.1 cysteine desulfurase CsdA [Porphyromonadaceae bacterium]HBQ55855.1 cysteine desulfurase CsdA [Porphyromonadaceae bacterium]HCB90067.1 cysteine desulfurase CsdA [Porphyromonadaceae bacterium]